LNSSDFGRKVNIRDKYSTYWDMKDTPKKYKFFNAQSRAKLHKKSSIFKRADQNFEIKIKNISLEIVK
jgi:hypothetical protein